MSDPARRGKIARLPLAVREELNRRLQAGETARKILPWLNSLDDVKRILTEDFEGLCVNDQNLSDWRKGGYQDWLKQNDRRLMRAERTRELAQMSMKLAEAGGGSLAEGAAAMIGGDILELLELMEEMRHATDEAAEDPEKTKERIALISSAIENLTLAVARLRKGDHNKEQLRQNEERLKQAREELDLAKKKYQRETCRLFIEWQQDQRALSIVSGAGDNATKIEQLGRAMFPDWDEEPK